MLLTRRKLLQAGAATLGTAAVAGPLVSQARGGDFMYPWGLDVSHWQGTINWNAVHASGNIFTFIKATEGTTYRDPQFTRNWSEMRRVGIFRGAYHFAQPSASPSVAQSAINQANFFHGVVRPIQYDLQLCLDLESRGTPALSVAQLWSWVQSFVTRIRQLTGRSPIIYTSPGFWTSYVGNPLQNLDCPLWVAHWGVLRPTVPRAWSTWTFWQWTSSGSWPGISGRVDQDTFNGLYSRLWYLTFP